MSLPLAKRLEAARRSRFVGRSAELERFQSAIAAHELPFYVLHIFGPGGVGKTTLLREFAHLAGLRQIPAIYLDGRNLEPAPDLFVATLQQVIGAAPTEALPQFLTSQKKRFVILIDTYETLAPLDGWLRDVFLPQLPGNTLFVLAGRNPPALPWRTDPGWEPVVSILPLRNLSSEESRTYLAKRQIPTGQHKPVLDFTHGHPLALSLVADVFAQRQTIQFQPEATPDIIKTLLEQLVQKVPGPAHRAALEACALVRLTTESLLAAMLANTDVHELFEWLRDLSFIEADAHGIFPHDLAREALAADLRWRNPDWYTELHRRARLYYVEHLERSDSRLQRRILFDYIFLHRDNPVVRPYFEWKESGSVFTGVMRPADEPALLVMVEQHEGPESAGLAAHWLSRQPQAVSVFRDAAGQLQGFLLSVALHQATPADLAADPATAAAWRYLQAHAPLRPGEVATYFRFWLAADTYQAVSPVQSRIFLNAVQHYLTTPGLAFTFFACAEPEFWLTVFTYAELARLEAVDFTIGRRRYGVYGHDWRAIPPTAWLTLMAEREIATGAPPPPSRQTEVLIVLSQPDFSAAVRDALHHYTDVDALKANPLLRSRLVIRVSQQNGSPGTGAGPALAVRVATLQKLLQDAAASLQQSPRQAKFYRALYHTCFQPASTQEQVAELLDLPFSTYRRHLRAGIEHVTGRLWQQEIGVPAK